MSSVSHGWPHLARLLGRLRAEERPVIQLWGWPGSGRQALLDALEAAEGSAAARLTGPQLAGEEAWPEEPAWLLVREELEIDLGQLAHQLRPGQRCVVARTKRWAGRSLRVALIPPEELLLKPEEMLELAVEAGWLPQRTAPGDPRVEALGSATDGWWEPTRLAVTALAEVAGSRPESTRIERVTRSFLSRRVLAPLSVDTRQELALTSLCPRLDSELWEEIGSLSPERRQARELLFEELGLSVDHGAHRRLPACLVAHGRAELARWPGDRLRQAARQIALAAFGRGWPEVALEALLEAGEVSLALRLVRQDWWELWLRASVPLLNRLSDVVPEPDDGPSSLLVWCVRAIEGEPATARSALEALARAEEGDGLLSSAAALVGAALEPGVARPGVVERVRRRLTDRDQWVPEPLEGLLKAVETGRAGRKLVLGEAPVIERLMTAYSAGGPTTSSAPRIEPAPEEKPSSERLDVQLFGVPRVQVPGSGEEVRWSLRRAFSIFAFVASAPDQRASREEILEAGWPGERESVVQRNFHPTLSHLRRAMRAAEAERPVLLFVNGVYQLNPELAWRIDCAEFERRIEQGRLHAEVGELAVAETAWEGAWKLYRGAFLEGFYEPWVEERREALSRRYLEMLRRLGELHLERGNRERAVDAFRSVLAVDPLQESIHLEIMRIYAHQARRDLVRRQYDRLTRLLRDELSIEPLEETTTEYHRLMG